MENTIHLKKAHFTVPQSLKEYGDMQRATQARHIASLREQQAKFNYIKHALDQITKPKAK